MTKIGAPEQFQSLSFASSSRDIRDRRQTPIKFNYPSIGLFLAGLAMIGWTGYDMANTTDPNALDVLRILAEAFSGFAAGAVGGITAAE